MAGLGRQFERHRRLVADVMNDIEALGEANQPLVIRHVAAAPPLHAVMDEGRASDQAEIEVVVPDIDAPRRIARRQGKAPWRNRQALPDDLAVDAHEARVVIDLCSGLLQQVARRLAHELDADRLEEPQRCLVNRLDMTFGKDRDRRGRPAEPAVVAPRRFERRRAGSPAAAWRPGAFSGQRTPAEWR